MTFTLASGSDLTLKESALGLSVFGIDAGLTAADVIADFDVNCKIYDESGNIKTGSVCTGDTIRKIINGKETIRAMLIVTGDTTCDGIVNGKDLIQAKKAILKYSNKGYGIAADIDLNGTLEDSDLSALVDLIK